MSGCPSVLPSLTLLPFRDALESLNFAVLTSFFLFKVKPSKFFLGEVKTLSEPTQRTMGKLCMTRFEDHLEVSSSTKGSSYAGNSHWETGASFDTVLWGMLAAWSQCAGIRRQGTEQVRESEVSNSKESEGEGEHSGRLCA